MDRRQDHAKRRREHIAELNKRAAEAELRLKRLYDAIEAGVADLDDPALKDRIAGLKATRDQAQADALRAQAMLESATHQTVTPQMLRRFADTARKRMRADGGGYRRDHLRLLAQRVEVEDKQVRIMGSKSNLLRTLAAISSSGVKSDSLGVPSFVPKWRKRWDSNPRWSCPHGGFQDRCLKPLGHPSLGRDIACPRRRARGLRLCRCTSPMGPIWTPQSWRGVVRGRGFSDGRGSPAGASSSCRRASPPWLPILAPPSMARFGRFP